MSREPNDQAVGEVFQTAAYARSSKSSIRAARSGRADLAASLRENRAAPPAGRQETP
jgi:hypothetical protein